VAVDVPNAFAQDVIGLMTRVEQITVQPDQQAKVVIDEKSGIIVIGENVRIGTVAIAQGNLTIRISEAPQVSQPNALAQQGTTTTVPRTNIQVNEGETQQLGIVGGGVSLQELVAGLNALGVGPRDLISILQSIKAAGALQAQIEVM
jgi:flagellar P-ring protein FlgI